MVSLRRNIKILILSSGQPLEDIPAPVDAWSVLSLMWFITRILKFASNVMLFEEDLRFSLV